MSRTVYLALALLALVCSVAAHAGHNRGGMPYGWRNKRAVSASTCSAFTCALTSVGSACDTGKICTIGQYCDGSNTCQLKKALGTSCDASTGEKNVCSEGSCVNNICQHSRDVMPGNACSSDNECSYFESADGSGSDSGSCVSGVCYGKQVGQTCAATHQCVAGSFCDQDSICKTFATENQACRADAADGVTGCDARFTCIDNKCSKRYTRSEGQSCVNTHNCQANLYCSSSKTCTKVSNVASSGTACDISAPNCGVNEECACKDYSTAGSVATCNAIQGTFDSMATYESAAYTCMDNNKCGSDLSNNATVACIQKNCKKDFCTYFTRNVNEIYSNYPSCMVARMAETNDFASLLGDCTAYAPTATPPAKNGSSMVSVSFAALVSFIVFFFAL